MNRAAVSRAACAWGGTVQYARALVVCTMLWCVGWGTQPDMPLASGRETGSRELSAPYRSPLSNTRPRHHRNSVGTCCVQRVAE